ncbi:MAG: FAD-dependent oxidoreductase [Deltaproteobacteria bacterium]|nr:FAD-dependent oxidoreductase [Deltaproteobacteria bacterium]
MHTSRVTDAEASFDVAVIGAGAGGMCAAARLTAAGKKVLLVESRDRVGGRAGSGVESHGRELLRRAGS